MLPFFIGLAFGFVFGGALTIALNNQDGALLENMNNTLNQFMSMAKEGDWGSLKSLGAEYSAKYLVIPIIPEFPEHRTMKF